jgi:tetratricopeptide (TPR) repeat protein
MFKKPLLIQLFIFLLCAAAFAQQPQKAADTVLVMPFENASANLPEFNWVGESFALSLSDLLKFAGVDAVENAERKIIQQRLRIPLTNLPSLATSLKLSRETGATLLILGSYKITPAEGDSAATLSVTAKIVRVNEGRFLSEVMSDGRRITRDINLTDALGNLQTMEGQVAYQILYQRDKALPFSQNQLIEAANKVPARAFEAYIKGMMTSDVNTREIYFRNAMRLYADDVADGIYADAGLELGHLYLGQNKRSEAIDAFEQVIYANKQCSQANAGSPGILNCDDESYAEASFYIGLIQWQQGNLEQAMAVLQPLADDLKLTSVYNTLGAIAVQRSRTEKKNQAQAAADLTEGEDFLRQASDSAPDNSNVRFNYAVALYMSGNAVEAAEELRAVIEKKPNDGEAYFVLAKALGDLKDQAATEADNQARKFLTTGNRYANLETEWNRSKSLNTIAMRVEQPRRNDFVSVVLSRKNAAPTAAASSETDKMLDQARTEYKNGNDDAAMTVLRRILASEPMNAESYLLLGKIHLRRGDIEQAVSSFKTALFWDNKKIDAHIALGKIALERGFCLQVTNYAASAAELDPENPDVIALQRSAERCSK